MRYVQTEYVSTAEKPHGLNIILIRREVLACEALGSEGERGNMQLTFAKEERLTPLQKPQNVYLSLYAV